MATWRQKTKTLYRKMYTGVYEKVTLLKRDDDQRQGVVREVTLFRVRKTDANKTNTPIQGDMTADHRTTWHLPRYELQLAGVSYINVLDRIVDDSGRYWQPESSTNINVDALENMVSVDCLRVDP